MAIRTEEATVSEVRQNGDAAEIVPVSPAEGAAEALGPAAVGHVVDFYHRYPGESVTFFTCLELREPVEDVTLRVTIPEGLALETYQAPPELPGLMPAIEVEDQTYYVAWHLNGAWPAGARYEFRAVAEVASTPRDITYQSRAALTNADFALLAEEEVRFSVWVKGSYLRYLPEFYEQDNLMGRFLMLFESFWAPVTKQIKSIHYYLDPRLTPAPFLPWLASWLDLELDERWPEARQRQLIRWAIALHRSRGTRWGLQKYLELFTGQKAQIIEHRAKNFQLGSGRLGPSIALGKDNKPHTFTVNLRLPALDQLEDEAERDRQEKLRRRAIESIIEMQKPAHTLYILNLEMVPPDELESAAEPEASDEEEEAAEAQDELDAQASIWFPLDDE